MACRFQAIAQGPREAEFAVIHCLTKDEAMDMAQGLLKKYPGAPEVGIYDIVTQTWTMLRDLQI